MLGTPGPASQAYVVLSTAPETRLLLLTLMAWAGTSLGGWRAQRGMKVERWSLKLSPLSHQARDGVRALGSRRFSISLQFEVLLEVCLSRDEGTLHFALEFLSWEMELWAWGSCPNSLASRNACKPTHALAALAGGVLAIDL